MRRPPTIFLPFLVLCLLLGACGGREAARPDYRKFVSEEGRFSADFPGSPQSDERTETAGDVELTLHHFTVDNGSEAVSVSYIDYPEAVGSQDPGALLDSIADNAAESADGNIEGSQSVLTAKTPTEVGDNPAIDFEVNINQGDPEEDGSTRKLEARAVLVGSRMYLLQVVREPEIGSESFQRLTSSFTLF